MSQQPQGPSPFSPFRVGPLTLRNRFIKSATNEGMARGGVTSGMLVKWHEQFAEGGVALTTVAYCAVSPDGRTFVDQVTMDRRSLPDLRALTDAVHRHGGAASAQITHGGAAIARVLEREGAHMLVLSAGMNVESITTMFGSSFPKENRARPPNFIIAAGMFLQSLTEPKNVQFRELYLLEHSRKVRAAVTMPLAYLGGVESLANVEQAMGEGFEAVALGRALIFDPHLANHFRDHAVEKSGCIRCNRCVTAMYTPAGTSCVLHAPNDARLNVISGRNADMQLAS